MDCRIDREIEYLTVFAFSSENWKRPSEEVSGLMSLVLVAVSIEMMLRGVRTFVKQLAGA